MFFPGCKSSRDKSQTTALVLWLGGPGGSLQNVAEMKRSFKPTCPGILSLTCDYLSNTMKPSTTHFRQRSSQTSSLDAAAAVALAGLQHYEPLVHHLQDGRIHFLHDVLQLVGVRFQVVHFYKWLEGEGGGQQRWASVFKLNNSPPPFPNRPIPHCLQTRSTAGSGCCRGSWRRRRCCCRRPHTRSQGNIAGPKTYQVTSGAQKDLFCLKFMSLFPMRTGLKAENVMGTNLIPHKWLHKAHHLNLKKALIRLRFSFPFSGAKHLSFQFHFTPLIEAKAENTFKHVNLFECWILIQEKKGKH